MFPASSRQPWTKKTIVPLKWKLSGAAFPYVLVILIEVMQLETQSLNPIINYAILYNLLITLVAPEIHVPNQLVGVQVGSDITIECRVEAYPRVSLKSYYLNKYYLNNFLFFYYE